MARERAPAGAITEVADARQRRDVGYLIERLADPNQEVRWVAANSLRTLGVDAAPAVDALLRIAENAADEPFLILALKALGEAGQESAVPRLRTIAAGDEPLTVRATAMRALVRLHDRAVVPLLLDLARGTKGVSASARRWAARRLVDLKATEAIPGLESASRRGGPITRLALWRAVRELQEVDSRA